MTLTALFLGGFIFYNHSLGRAGNYFDNLHTHPYDTKALTLTYASYFEKKLKESLSNLFKMRDNLQKDLFYIEKISLKDISFIRPFEKLVFIDLRSGEIKTLGTSAVSNEATSFRYNLNILVKKYRENCSNAWKEYNNSIDFNRFLDSQKRVVGLSLDLPVCKDNEIIGFIRSEVSVLALRSIFDDLFLPYQNKVWVLDEKKNFLLYPINLKKKNFIPLINTERYYDVQILSEKWRFGVEINKSTLTRLLIWYHENHITLLSVLFLICTTFFFFYLKIYKKRVRKILSRDTIEKELIVSNNILQIKDEMNKALMKYDDVYQVLNVVCNRIIELGNYQFAWICEAVHDEFKTVKEVARYGEVNNYLDELFVSWGDTTFYNCPVGRTIKLGRPSSININSNPSCTLWVQKAKRQGFKSTISLPLKIGNEVFGALSIYSSDENAFKDKEVSFLSHMATDLGHGIEILLMKKREKINLEKISSYQGQLSHLVSKIETTKEQERRKVATDLHDRIGQTLAMSKIKLGMLANTVNDKSSISFIEEVNEYIEQAIKDTRIIISELTPVILYELGLIAAWEWLIEQTQEKYGISVYINSYLMNKNDIHGLSEDIKIFLFRSLHELLMNCIKHSKTRQYFVSWGINEKEEFYVIVEDRGEGFDLKILDNEGSESAPFGIFSLREQINNFNGSFEIKSSLNNGCKVILKLPIILSRISSNISKEIQYEEDKNSFS